MSLITCCPTCQTMFQVSGEDLRVSDGWVRCGKCNGVFDASAHLQAMPDEKPSAQPPAQPERETPGDGMPFEVDRAEDAAEIAPVDAKASIEESRDELSPATFRREDQSSRPSVTAERVSFSSRPPSRRSGWRLVFWSVMLVVLAVALLGWVRHERQALVQRLPALLPVLESLCSVSACEMKAPRQLDMIVIEETALQDLTPSDYKIQLVLKNTGSGPVELPSLKVTLTGPQGEVLASHIASPLQFAPSLPRLASNAPLRVAFNFSLALAPAAIQASALAPASIPASAATPATTTATTSAATSATPEPLSAEAAQSPDAPVVSGYRVIAFYP